MTLSSLYSTLEQKLGLGLWRGLEDSEWLIWVGPGLHTLTCQDHFNYPVGLFRKTLVPTELRTIRERFRDRLVPCFEVCNTPHLSIPSGFFVALVENLYFPMVFISKSSWQEYPPEARSSEIVGL